VVNALNGLAMLVVTALLLVARNLVLVVVHANAEVEGLARLEAVGVTFFLSPLALKNFFLII
jgi:hypothetical protein